MLFYIIISSLLEDPFNRILGRFESQGILNYWLNEEHAVNRILGRRISSRFRKPGFSKKKTKDQSILHLIVIIAVGNGLALFLFGIEVFHGHYFK